LKKKRKVNMHIFALLTLFPGSRLDVLPGLSSQPFNHEPHRRSAPERYLADPQGDLQLVPDRIRD
jgi:hypothetical protein